VAEYKLLLKDLGTPELWRIDSYESVGGYQQLRDALKKYAPDEIVEEVKKSGLRGRGGAGFPTGMKWSFLPKDVFPRYLCVNADESETACFKDRYLID
jgi:NADH-quinone oxidoreductase subunit F